MTEPRVTMSTRVLWPLLRALEARGASTEALCQGLSVTPATLRDPRARLDHSTAVALGVRGVELCGDPLLFLRAHEYAEPDDFDVIAYVARSSATVGDAMRALARYQGLMHDGIACGLDQAGDCGEFWFSTTHGARLAPAAMEYLMGLTVLGGARVVGVSPNVVEARFPYPAPDHADAYRDVFGVPVRFDAERTAAVYRRAVLVQPLQGADAGLQRVLELHAQDLLRALPRGDAFVDQVRRALMRLLPTGQVSLGEVARQVGMADSTFRRHLKGHGTSYRTLLAELRLELACEYLQNPKLSVSEVAFLLGFSECSAFDKAFKRWTGVHPSAYRRQ